MHQLTSFTLNVSNGPSDEMAMFKPADDPGPKQRKRTWLCSHLITLWRGGSHRLKAEGLLEEISKERAVVSLSCPLRAGTEVKIDCTTCELRGKVVGCRQGAGDYFADIEFAENEGWKPSNFTPDALFNPQSMICNNPGCRSDCVNEGCGAMPNSDR